MSGGGMRSYDMDDPEPITAVEAAERLGCKPATIRKWAERYKADQIDRVGRAVYYDFWDLATIEWLLRLGEPVPATPDERDERRARSRNRAA